MNLREKVLREWNTLQTKLNRVKYLHQQKALITNAIEYYVNPPRYWGGSSSKRLTEKEVQSCQQLLAKLRE